MSNFSMGTILGKGFPQAQVHTVHSTSAEILLIWECSFRKDLIHCVKYYMRISSRRLGNLRFSSISEHSVLRIDANIKPSLYAH